MNCKKGDLAFIIRGVAIDALVECVEWLGLVDCPYTFPRECWKIKMLSGARYDFSGTVFEWVPGEFAACPDSSLRPLRGDLSKDGADETTDKREPVSA